MEMVVSTAMAYLPSPGSTIGTSTHRRHDLKSSEEFRPLRNLPTIPG